MTAAEAAGTVRSNGPKPRLRQTNNSNDKSRRCIIVAINGRVEKVAVVELTKKVAFG
jgi:hypothetical protein